MSTFVDVVAHLQLATQQINRYVTLFLLLLGITGNLCNCLVFTQRNLRSNPCCVYFLAAALVNLIVCTIVFIPRSIDGWNKDADLTETVSAICRLFMFLLLTTRCVAVWIIALASIDRCLVSSPNTHRRQLSNLKNTYRSISFICVLALFVWVEVFFCFDANEIGTPIKCYTTSDVCQIYNNLATALLMVIFPVLVMLIFGFSTITNIRRHQHVAPIAPRKRRSDRSLTKMLLLQVFVLILFSFPFTTMILYLSWTFYSPKTPMRQVIEGFLFNIFLLMAFIPNCISFWLYTLSGSVFRRTFLNVRQKIIRRLPCANSPRV